MESDCAGGGFIRHVFLDKGQSEQWEKKFLLGSLCSGEGEKKLCMRQRQLQFSVGS